VQTEVSAGLAHVEQKALAGIEGAVMSRGFEPAGFGNNPGRAPEIQIGNRGGAGAEVKRIEHRLRQGQRPTIIGESHVDGESGALSSLSNGAKNTVTSNIERTDEVYMNQIAKENGLKESGYSPAEAAAKLPERRAEAIAERLSKSNQKLAVGPIDPELMPKMIRERLENLERMIQENGGKRIPGITKTDIKDEIKQIQYPERYIGHKPLTTAQRHFNRTNF
jgi:hypothetical protein